MRRIETRHDGARAPSATLTLPFDRRQKSRLRARLDDGREVAIALKRGCVLEHGDLLELDDGEIVRVVAEPESVSVVRAEGELALCRAAYHLGNRHVPLQIAPGELCYLHDHVLDAMVVQLGLEVRSETRPFAPETGAYGAGHAHLARGHSHHDHDHPHHDHGHSHHDHDHSSNRSRT